MKFRTETGSTYEVDFEKKTCIRLSGKGDATGRMRSSGRQFSSISDIEIGQRVVVVWGEDTPLLPGSPDDATPTTVTSRVVEVDGAK